MPNRPHRIWFFPLVPVVFAATMPGQTWTQASPQTSPPGFGAFMAYHAARAQVVLYAGSANTWVFAGANWTHKNPKTTPPPSCAEALAYDAVHRETVLACSVTLDGGLTSSEQTWVWDGTNWTQRFPKTTPPARTGAALSYDAARGQVVMFGGMDTNTLRFYPTDTWLWDGQNWTLAHPSNAPFGREYASMAYDAVHGQTVLFRGYTLTQAIGPASVNLLGDTWIWDGATWIQRSPQNSPSAGTDPMAPDRSGHILLFEGGQQPNNNTWLWDGSNWTKATPPVPPTARDFADSVAYDAGRGLTVLFGGRINGQIVNDTWLWDSGRRGPGITAVVTASSYGASINAAPSSWIEIYGIGLANTSRSWTTSDFNGNIAPTALSGVQVTIAGQRAPVQFIAIGQVNAQVPSGIAAGPAQVVVTNNSTDSPAYTIIVKAAAPGLLSPPAFNIAGNQYVTALLADNTTFVLPSGAIPGIASRPAQPGETMVLFGVGFGAVNPSIPAGQVVTEDNQLAQPLSVSFGQAPARIAYSGLAPGLIGLYQFNVVVPEIPNSDVVPLTLTVGGIPITQTLVTAVHN